MGSSVKPIDCPNCGGWGWVDDDYKDGYRVTDCQDCDYVLVETYNPHTKEIHTSEEKNKGSVRHNKW